MVLFVVTTLASCTSSEALIDSPASAQSASVPLTSIAQPKYQLGFAAAQLAIEECENPTKHTHQRIEFQPQLIVRSSTSPVSKKSKGI